MAVVTRRAQASADPLRPPWPQPARSVVPATSTQFRSGETAAMIGGVGAVADAAGTDIATMLDTARRTFGPDGTWTSPMPASVANQASATTNSLGPDHRHQPACSHPRSRLLCQVKRKARRWGISSRRLRRQPAHPARCGAPQRDQARRRRFAEWLAISYGDRGIGVSCVCPMGVDTPLLSGMADSPDAGMRMAGT